MWFVEAVKMGKPEQERVQHLLQDTVTLLCKNSLQFTKEMKVQGLLGVTLDDSDVFIVHINELYGVGGVLLTPEVVPRGGDLTSTPSKNTNAGSGPSTPTSASKRRRQMAGGDVIDLEKDDDVTIMNKRSRVVGSVASGTMQVSNVQGNFASYNRMPGRGGQMRGVGDITL